VADRFVLDTSALLTLRSDEPGAGRVAAILQSGRTGRASMLLSFMTRMEMLYRIGASDGDESARRAVMLVEVAGIEWVSCEAEILAEAARLKSAGGLSVADAWIAATAWHRDAVLVHKDAEFARCPDLKQEVLRR
jgi:predicted nucleic acid-binding protein